MINLERRLSPQRASRPHASTEMEQMMHALGILVSSTVRSNAINRINFANGQAAIAKKIESAAEGKALKREPGETNLAAPTQWCPSFLLAPAPQSPSESPLTRATIGAFSSNGL